ncbi:MULTISPECIES: phage major capsid protein [Bacillus subtilis group]|uniref:phage major capsid protein n=1 Tax=Bacillus velezensis TaxID=492670 RepID=UPI000EF1CC28|nr:phage major capsid protein [Bacillus subtilis]AYK64164.1 phage major capsid protein [Bacillus subtilis subsp. subtilis]
MKYEELKNTWITAGQKVSDAQNALQLALVDDEVSAETLKELKAKVEATKAKRDLAKEQLDEAEKEGVAQARQNLPTPIPNTAEAIKEQFVKDFKDMLTGTYSATLTTKLDENGNGVGLTIPQDIQTAVNKLKRQFDALEQYVDVIPVSNLSGTRVIEKLSEITPFKNIDDEEDTINDVDEPSAYILKYLIQRYAGISTITNTLLKESSEKIIEWVTDWLAKKSTATRNAKILAALDGLPASQKTTVTNVDDIKNVVNVKLDPALQTTAFYLTNQSGFNELDKVKDAFGHYLLQPNPQNATQKLLLSKPVVVISDKFLKNGGTASKPTYPLFIGDLKEAVKLFDREQMSLLMTNVGAGAFEKDQTKIRAIDRFDVRLWDEEAVVFTTFTKIDDEKPATQAS